MLNIKGVVEVVRGCYNLGTHVHLVCSCNPGTPLGPEDCLVRRRRVKLEFVGVSPGVLDEGPQTPGTGFSRPWKSM